MDAQLVVALLAAFVAVLSAILAAWANWRNTALKHELDRAREKENRAETTAEVMGRYSKPLLWAAYELAARLYHICQRDWLKNDIRNGTERQVEYAMVSTAFLFAQYFTWVEILRRRVQFLDEGDNQRTHQLQNLIEMVEHVASTERLPWTKFLTRRMELRGIAECMLQVNSDGTTECCGYATYVERYQAQNSPLAYWLSPFTESLRWLVDQDDQNYGRLADLQRNLIDLIGFLDPDHIRLPDRRVNRVAGDNFVVKN